MLLGPEHSVLKATRQISNSCQPKKKKKCEILFYRYPPALNFLFYLFC